jgi:hypothetical protein
MRDATNETSKVPTASLNELGRAIPSFIFGPDR